MNTKELGKKGEKAVVKYLKKNKYEVIYTNFSTIKGEVDIIAEKGRIIAFVEVKTRTEGQMLEPSLSVDKKKQHRIFCAATHYINKFKIKKQPRYDIAEVIVDYKGKTTINYLKGAFEQEGNDYAVF